MEWISVGDRLPEEDGTLPRYVNGDFCLISVLAVCNKGVTMKERIYSDGHWQWLNMTPYYEDVTHWMPIPEPPKEME